MKKQRKKRKGVKGINALPDVQDCTHPLHSDQWRVKFLRHRCQAKYRGEAYELTYEQYLTAWYDSGQWQRAGVRKNSYQMKRLDASKPWHKDNVTMVQHHWRLVGKPIHQLTYSVHRYADEDLVKKDSA
tara:strand:- start:15 stop:401 length:387 start_codon:yes stop_codon:yes gene_type:complete